MEKLEQNARANILNQITKCKSGNLVLAHVIGFG